MLLTSRRQHRARSTSSDRRSALDPSLIALLKARRTWICRIESALAPLDLSSTELGVLHALRDADEPLTYGELALATTNVSSELDGVTQSLLAKGLILKMTVVNRDSGLGTREQLRGRVRSTRRGDRSVRVAITAQGLLRHAEGARALDEVSATFAALIQDGDREALDRIVSLVASR